VTNNSPEKEKVLVRCARCEAPFEPRSTGGMAQRYCSVKCRQAVNNSHKKKKVRVGAARKRRPLPEFAKDAAWVLRRDVERVERIFADDRFGAQKEEVTTLLRGHLSYAAEVCQDLLSRIDHPTGE